MDFKYPGNSFESLWPGVENQIAWDPLAEFCSSELFEDDNFPPSSYDPAPEDTSGLLEDNNPISSPYYPGSQDASALVYRVRPKYPTPQEWENIRPVFTKLYREENKTLPAVKEILQREYGFPPATT
jgi:hypothetical protein